MAIDLAVLPLHDTVTWIPQLIKQLRGRRTQAAFGTLLGAAKNTVWRWEAGQAHPDATYAARLSALAAREQFLANWQLVGSMTLVGDVAGASAEVAALFQQALERTAHQLLV